MPRAVLPLLLLSAILAVGCDNSDSPNGEPPDIVAPPQDSEDKDTRMAVLKCKPGCPIDGSCIWSVEWDTCVCRNDDECMASNTCKTAGHCWCDKRSSPTCNNNPDWDKPKK